MNFVDNCFVFFDHRRGGEKTPTNGQPKKVASSKRWIDRRRRRRRRRRKRKRRRQEEEEEERRLKGMLCVGEDWRRELGEVGGSRVSEKGYKNFVYRV